MDNLQGTLLKGYKLEERVGSGGFGAVYRARQTTIGREVAIKIILPGYANDPDFIRRFESEAHLIARLEHPHITPLHDFWRDPDGAYLVMRFLKGGSVQQALRESSYALTAVSLMLDQIASALDFAHRNEIIHRDIKPGNILLDEDGNAYLADFGIAKDLGILAKKQTAPDAVIGSLDYISPEQARSEPVTPRTDVYSLGVTLYEMITGEHPFKEASTIERLYKHINDPLPDIEGLPDDVSDMLNDTIHKATAKDPARRYPDVMALAVAFREAIGRGEPQHDATIVEQLTMREQEILALIAKGMSRKEIASHLFITMSTVKWHTTQLYKKLGIRSRVQAIVRARELNLIVNGESADSLHGLTISTTAISLPEPENPYKGLHAFQMTDARDFFGRDELKQKLIDRMCEDDPYHRFLAIVGPSGSGKSSLVKAGLIPALWNGAISGSEKWFVVDMIPGTHPLDKLETALIRVAANHTGSLREQLQRDVRGLLRVADIILPDDGSELVIVVDQFEEVFTLVEQERDRQHFLDLMRVAVSDVRSRVRVVVTLRADYYDRPLHYPEFGEIIRSRMETVLPLSAKGLERAVRGPAERVGVTFEQGLVEQIVSTMNYQAGALPLLQYALTELFDRRRGRLLTNEAYQHIGGAVGALANRADEIFNSLTDEAQALAHQMFLRLVTLGEGAEDTRRRAAQAELLSLTGNTELMEEIIDTFALYRLLLLDHDPATRQPTIEVAHEAILREWDRLRGWLNESREDIRQQRELAVLAADWQAHGQDGAYLVRESRLERLHGWADDTELSLTPLEHNYLAACVVAEAQRLADERGQIERENRLRHQRQRILQGLVAVFLVAAVIAGMLAWEANIQRVKAEDAEHEALRQASIGLAASVRDTLEHYADRQVGVLLALEAVQHYPRTPHAVGALALAVEQYHPHHILDSTGVMTSSASVAAWSPDGTRIAAGGASNPNSVVIWDASTRDIVLAANPFGTVCSEPHHWIYDLVWSPDGTQLAGIANTSGSGAACGIVVMDSTTGAALLTIDDPDSPAWSLDWSSDGTTLATGHEDGMIRLWDANTGMAKSTLTGHEGFVYGTRFSPDSARIATASGDGSVRLWDATTGEEQMALRGHVGSVNAVRWSPDGTRIVSGGFDALPRVWDVSTGQTLFVLAGHTESVVGLSWSEDDRRIASQSFDATVKVWDAVTGGLFFEITNVPPSGTLKKGYAEFEPAGNWLVTGGGIVTGVELWDTTRSVPVLFGHSFGQEWGGWSPDGRFIATSGTDGSARLWDATTGEQVREFDQGSYRSAWSPDSTRLVTAEGVNASALNVWDVRSGEMLVRLTTGDDGTFGFLSTDWSPDGNFIVASGFRAGAAPAIFTWDANTYELLSTFPSDDGCAPGWPTLSPDNSRIVSGCLFVAADVRTAVHVWDAKTGELLRKLDNPAAGWTYFTSWSPDGTQILSSHDGSTIVIWDAESGEIVRTFTEHQGGTGADWSPDGTLVASRGFTDREVKIWDARTGEVLISFAVTGSVLNVAWSPDSSYIMISGDGINEPIIKRVWRSTDDLVAHAYECCVFRDLTPQERRQFGLPERGE